jgi:glycosyltransferase involved in cell wall biosynthesis
VLLIDEAVSFGGSMMVAGTLARAIRPAEATVHLVFAASPEVLDQRTRGSLPVTHLAKRFDYLRAGGVRRRVARWPGLLRRGALAAFAPLGLAWNARYVAGLVRLIRRERIDLVHLNNGLSNLEGWLAAVLARRPLLVHAHGLAVGSRLRRYMASRVRRFVAISEVVRDRIVSELRVPQEKVVHLANPLTVAPGAGSREAQRRARATWGIPNGAPTFGTVGRIIRWKGQLEFVRAAARVLSTLPEAHALVIGDSADGGEAYAVRVRQEADRLGIGDRVHFTGYLRDPAAIYPALDVLVHTSIEPEPFGLVLIEAMASGIPVVASPLGAPPEIVREGVDGFLRTPTDSEAVAEAVTTLLRDPGLRQRMGSAGQARVAERHDPVRYAARMAEVYREAVAAPLDAQEVRPM